VLGEGEQRLARGAPSALDSLALDSRGGPLLRHPRIASSLAAAESERVQGARQGIAKRRGSALDPRSGGATIELSGMASILINVERSNWSAQLGPWSP
jgi:hypothetical protein